MKNKYKKTQTILEYAMVIASVATALMVIQHYFNRSIQGKLKDTADQLGSQYFSAAFSVPLPESGYRVSPASTNNNIGKTVSFHSSSSASRSTTDFTYEGEHQFVITTSATNRSERGTLTASAGSTSSSARYDTPVTPMEGDAASVRDRTLDSPLNPGDQENQNNVNNRTTHWGDGSRVTSGNALTTQSEDSIIVTSEEGQIQSGTEATLEQIDSMAENVYTRHNPEGNLYDGNGQETE